MNDEPRTPADGTEVPADASLLRAAPGLARIGVAVSWRLAGWAAGTTTRAGSRVLQAATSGESATELLQSLSRDAREYARRALELVDAETGLRTAEPGGDDATPPGRSAKEIKTAELRKRGSELLRQSADVHFAEEAHPAYARILDQLAPDEGRILRLLAQGGPQASVDVRTGTLPISVNSQLVAPGLTMIGAQAGCRHLDRVHPYLNNLYRLGLVWFSREPLEDPLQYQVLEAQPEVLKALKEAGRARTVRRSIHLTPFGEDFCETCLPLHTEELDALPGGERST